MAGIIIAVLALVIAIWWQIFAKTGYGGAMSLLMLIPIVNFIMLLVLAFGDWPILQEVRRLRRLDQEDYRGRRGYDDEPPRGFMLRKPLSEDDQGITQ